MIYDVNGNLLNGCYDVDGSALGSVYNVAGDMVWGGEVQTDYSDPTIASYKTISIQNTQGMEVYNDVLFQFRGVGQTSGLNDTVVLKDFSTGSTVYDNMSIDSGHANAVSFGKTFYAQSDEFPIIYCGDWFDPIVHVNRITRTGATHLYDIVYDQTKAGYHSNPCIDFDNNIMYTVGYYLNSTETATGNYCIVCKWDLSNMTDNGDGTYTPTFISSYNRDFIYVMQDLKFNDGICWICSGYGNNTQYIYGMNPATGVFIYTLTMPITTEIEGLVWMLDTETGLYYAYVGFQGGIYYKITFSAVT